ncbi:MAG: DNA-directed RNA polymerase subunit alpha [Clostridia bacterium]|nr:DNA-directed RNA polymerase subunit alpha [Clostridia bacterium]
MIEIERSKIECVEKTDDNKYGKFVVEPLERGYGTTLGNALRRVMLSSMEGTAVTSIKIDNVLHEFTTVPGVVEDVTEIILNIKCLALKNHGTSDDQKKLIIDRTEEGEITAADIICPADVEILNPDLHIATLNGDARFYVELYIGHGTGYVSASNNKQPNQAIGIIPIDSIYSPVTKVNYSVENTRVGNNTEFDKLNLEVWTNGSITPEEAICNSAKIMCKYLELFVNLSGDVHESDAAVSKEEKSDKKVLETTIEELDLSVRSYNCLKRAGINTVEDLTNKTEEEMMKVRNLGRKSLDEVLIKLEAFGLKLADSDE